MPTADRKLRVFLCYAPGDKTFARELYKQLQSEAWIDPWLDDERLLPGQDRYLEMPKAILNADVVIVCLSNKSVRRDGSLQGDMQPALELVLEKPEGSVLLIPLRLDDSPPPAFLASRQYLDYSSPSHQAYPSLLKTLIRRGKAIGALDDPSPRPDTMPAYKPAKQSKPSSAHYGMPPGSSASLPGDSTTDAPPPVLDRVKSWLNRLRGKRD